MSSEAYTKERDSTVAEESVDGPQLYRPDVDVSAIDERKLMRRIDWHVVPWLAVLYLLNFLDRGNIGNARVCKPMLSIHRRGADQSATVVQYAERLAHN